MASIYRRTRTRPDGTTYKAKKFSLTFVDENGERQTLPGYTSRRLTQEKARKLEERVERIKAGLPVHAQESAQEPLGDVLGRWLEDLARQHSSPAYVKLCKLYGMRLRDLVGFKRLGDVRRVRFDDWVLREQRSRKWSDRTVNAHVEVAKTFLNWCVDQNLLAANPLARATKVRRPRKKRPRRALTPVELRNLLDVAEGRSLVYRVAALSGLRRGELSKVEARDVQVAPGPSPSARWRLRPEVTKARRFDSVPMLPECALEVIPLARTKGPGELLFPKVPTYDQVLSDVARAGIVSPGADGRVVDFHSLRYTFCTELAKRLPIQRVRQLMRHATIQLTLNLYADLGLTDLWDEAVGLPLILG